MPLHAPVPEHVLSARRCRMQTSLSAASGVSRRGSESGAMRAGAHGDSSWSVTDLGKVLSSPVSVSVLTTHEARFAAGYLYPSYPAAKQKDITRIFKHSLWLSI